MNEVIPRQRCSAAARSIDEPLLATAPTSSTWVLLEHSGAWGPDALTETPSIDAEIGAELSRRSKEHGFRILLIRRSPGRPESGSRSCFIARSVQGGTWMERIEVSGPADLLDLDIQALDSSVSPAIGEAVEYLWAVCTHGRRDPCCAEYGRRLIREGFGSDRLRHNLWESSHQGGHRFAANLALFPHGLFYGMVEPDQAGTIVDSYLDGRVVLDGYRGRSSFDELSQAADFLARRQDSLTGIDDLTPIRTADLGEGRYEVSFEGPQGGLAVRLEVTKGPMRPESCNNPKLTPVKLYRQVQVTPDLGAFPTV